MIQRFLRLFPVAWLCLFTAPSPGLEPVGAAARPRLELSGAWQFRTDPKDEGVRQQWHLPRVEYPKIILAMKPSGYWRFGETAPGKALDSSG